MYTQLPYIVHGKNVVADSTLIVKYLLRTYPGKPLFHGPQCHDWHSVILISLLLTSIKASHL